MDKEKNKSAEASQETAAGNQPALSEKEQKKQEKKQAKLDKKAAKAEEKKNKPQATFAPSAIIAELKKVQWPSFKQLVRSSGMVILFTLIFGLYFFVCEIAASALVSWVVSI